MAQMPANLQGANKEKRFSSHETHQLARLVKAREHVKTNENWSEIAAIIASSSGII